MMRNEKQKRKKSSHREAILIAAESLIRDTRSTDFSMLVLAERAGVSPATPYNVFGTKASILYVLLNQSLDGVFTKFGVADYSRKPYTVVLTAADAAASFFVADPDFYRPLYHHLIGVQDPVHRPAYMDRALQYWRVALTPLCDTGCISNSRDRDTIARAIVIHFVGAMDLWVQRELNSKEFHAHVMHGVTSILLGCIQESARSALEHSLRTALRAMPRRFSFKRAEKRRG